VCLLLVSRRTTELSEKLIELKGRQMYNNNYAYQLFYSKIKNANVFFLWHGMKSTYQWSTVQTNEIETVKTILHDFTICGLVKMWYRNERWDFEDSWYSWEKEYWRIRKSQHWLKWIMWKILFSKLKIATSLVIIWKFLVVNL